MKSKKQTQRLSFNALRRLEGRHAVVTGGGGVLGRAIVRRLVREGAKVAVWDKDEAALNAVISENGNTALLCSVVDVLNDQHISNAAQYVLDTFNGIDIVINNAGGALDKPFLLLEQTNEDWQQTIDINLFSVLRVTKAFISTMCEANYGRIINMGSKAGRYASYIDGPAYCASKGAVHAFTLSLAQEFGAKGITANAVLPGLIMSARVQKLWESRRSFEEREMIRQAIPLRHHGEANDVASTVAFLASDDAKFITGTLIDLNGGQSMTT